MPLLIDEPELELTRRMFGGAAHRISSPNPQKRLGGWLTLEGILRVFEQAVIWPREKPSPATMQTYRAMLTAVLAIGEQPLGSNLDPEDKEVVQATVETLRDKLILEFSEATPAQSQHLLGAIFESGTMVA